MNTCAHMNIHADKDTHIRMPHNSVSSVSTLCGQGKGTCQDTSGKVHSRLRGQKLVKLCQAMLSLPPGLFYIAWMPFYTTCSFALSGWKQQQDFVCVLLFPPLTRFFLTTPCPYNEACQKSRLRLYIKWPVVNVVMLLCQSSEVSSLPRHQIFVAPRRVCSHCA